MAHFTDDYPFRVKGDFKRSDDGKILKGYLSYMDNLNDISPRGFKLRLESTEFLRRWNRAMEILRTGK